MGTVDDGEWQLTSRAGAWVTISREPDVAADQVTYIRALQDVSFLRREKLVELTYVNDEGDTAFRLVPAVPAGPPHSCCGLTKLGLQVYGVVVFLIGLGCGALAALGGWHW